MKLLKSEKIMIVLTLCFLVFTVGVRLGAREKHGSVTISAAALPTAGISAAEASAGKAPEAETAKGSDKININTADAEELKSLYGIGDVLAQRIIDYREANGPFAKISDIKNVEGIGEGIYSNIYSSLRVD